MASKKPDEIPKGQQAVEDQGDNRPVNERGVYIHKDSGNVLEALSQSAADAFVRMGFVQASENEVKEYDARVKEAKKEQVEVYQKQQQASLGA